jgi:hypothetical protein
MATTVNPKRDFAAIGDQQFLDCHQDMTPRLQARRIVERAGLRRSELNAGLSAPAKTNDAFSPARSTTAERRAVLRPLDFGASSVAMAKHRSTSSFSPGAEAQLVMRACRRGVMSD